MTALRALRNRRTYILPKSVWESVSTDTARSREAIRSWFSAVIDDSTEGPLKANVLTRTADDATLKIRALFKTADGETKEFVRTLGRRFSITIKPPTAQRWE